MKTTNKLTIELTDQESWDLAQLCKRFGFVDALQCAASEKEAVRMLAVIGKIQDELKDIGINPR